MAAEAHAGKGKKHMADHLVVKTILGEGSFGQVYEGLLELPGGEHERVVLKRVKARVEGADEMAEMEHVLNVYAAKVARKAVADFLGFCDVSEEDSRKNKRLTPGLWLMWKYEGSRTLAYYLRRRDCMSALATDLGVPVEAVVPTAMKQIFEALAALHAAGLVHRDVKPQNIIFSEKERRFKLIDLGAMADLRNGTNYVPDESILDPLYCPPEQYVLPTTGPNLSAMLAPMSLATSPLLWRKWKPDRFDMFSAGLIMMQLSLQRLRTPAQLRTFSTVLANMDHDLNAWKDRLRMSNKETSVLDANDGAGWEMAAALLRPRRIKLTDTGHVEFIQGEVLRPSALEAQQFRFVTQGAAVPGSVKVVAGKVVAVKQPGSVKQGGSAKWRAEQQEEEEVWEEQEERFSITVSTVSLFKRVTEGLFDLEAKMYKQASATQVQGTTVKRLRQQVAAKEADEGELVEAEALYTRMQNRLTDLAGQWEKQAGVVSQMMARLGLGKKDVPKAGDILDKLKQEEQEEFRALRPTTRLPAFGMRRSKPEAAAEAPQHTLAEEEAAAAIASSSAPDSSSGNSNSENMAVLGKLATSAIYGGLKFTASALTAATELMVKVGKGAEAAMAEAAARREASNLYLDAVAALGLDTRASWEDCASRLNNHPNTERWSAILGESDLRDLYGDYVAALQRAQDREAAALQRAQDREAAGKKEDMTRSERVQGDLKDMLASVGATLEHPWRQARRAVMKDDRYQAAGTEAERERLFEEYMTHEVAQRPNIPSYTQPPMYANGRSPPTGVDSGYAVLAELREKQAQLKQEYEKMEVKLREMEEQLNSANQEAMFGADAGVVSSSGLPESGPLPGNWEPQPEYVFDRDASGDLKYNSYESYTARAKINASAK